jgi:hypothetical protein
MTVLARDAVASDHLVYAWPLPIGPECEVSCGNDEQVVMCPAWMVGDRLGPGRHHYRTPSPMHPVAAFFVRTSPVLASFDLTTGFIIPSTGQPVRLRAAGSLQIRCADPGLLIAQFVGLPFDQVNDGILRSVSRSIERMLARLLTRRVVMAASPVAVTESGMLPGIIEELIAYNPTAGAVFGVDLIRMGHLVIAADDGSSPYVVLPHQNMDWSESIPPHTGPTPGSNGEHARSSQPDISLVETARGRPKPDMPTTQSGEIRSGEINPRAKRKTEIDGSPVTAASGEILVRPKPPVPAPPPIPPLGTSPPGRRSGPIEVEVPPADDITQPGVRTPVPGSVHAPVRAISEGTPRPHDGSILGIGMGAIGGVVSGEIPMKVPPGARVLVPGPNGLMQSATVRQLLQGYYELEVGSSGETIWVPIAGVVPE